MNRIHRHYCSSAGWRQRMHGELLPGVLRGADLGSHPLEIGPGPGVATEWLRTRVPELTSIEIDHRLAESLKQRMNGTNVTVVEGDATAMPFESNRFTAAICFTMLHHVPYALQDRLLAETCRVLEPGAAFVGMDSIPNWKWNIQHWFDDRNPVDPAGFAARLEAAGFSEVKVTTRPTGFLFKARAN